MPRPGFMGHVCEKVRMRVRHGNTTCVTMIQALPIHPLIHRAWIGEQLAQLPQGGQTVERTGQNCAGWRINRRRFGRLNLALLCMVCSSLLLPKLSLWVGIGTEKEFQCCGGICMMEIVTSCHGKSLWYGALWLLFLLAKGFCSQLPHGELTTRTWEKSLSSQPACCSNGPNIELAFAHALRRYLVTF